MNPEPMLFCHECGKALVVVKKDGPVLRVAPCSDCLERTGKKTVERFGESLQIMCLGCQTDLTPDSAWSDQEWVFARNAVGKQLRQMMRTDDEVKQS